MDSTIGLYNGINAAVRGLAATADVVVDVSDPCRLVE